MSLPNKLADFANWKKSKSQNGGPLCLCELGDKIDKCSKSRKKILQAARNIPKLLSKSMANLIEK
jgi:hypothetical protein